MNAKRSRIQKSFDARIVLPVINNEAEHAQAPVCTYCNKTSNKRDKRVSKIQDNTSIELRRPYNWRNSIRKLGPARSVYTRSII